MAPALKPGDRIAVRPLREGEPHPGQVVLATIDGREVVKRVVAVVEDRVVLAGDNRLASTDPGPVPRSAVTAAVAFRYWPLLS